MNHRISTFAWLFTVLASVVGCAKPDGDAGVTVEAPTREVPLSLVSGRMRVSADASGWRLGRSDDASRVTALGGAHLGWGRGQGVRSSGRHAASRSRRGIERDLDWSVGVIAEHPDGVEQSWTVHDRPATPALEVRVSIDGAVYLGSGADGLVFRTIDHQYLVYGHGTWIDAEGRRTAVPTRFDGREIALTVPEQVLDGSSYPAVLDPIISTAYSLTPNQLTYSIADQEYPDVAVGSTSRLVVWNDERTGAVPAVFGAFNDESANPSDRFAFRIGSGRVTGTPVLPAVAYAGGIYLVAWATYDRVYAVRVQEGGGVLDSVPIELSVGGYSTGAAITTNGSEFVVAWIDIGTPGGVRAQRVSTSGALLGPRTTLVEDDAAHNRVRIEHDPAGGYWAVFDDDSLGDRDVAIVRLAEDGTVRDSVPIALAQGFADQWQADIAFEAGGVGLVVYTDSATAAIHGLTVQEGGGGALTVGAPTRISAGSGEQAPTVVHDGTNYRIGWISSGPGIPTAQVATVSGPVRQDGVTLGAGTSWRVALAVDTQSVQAIWSTANSSTQGADIFRRASTRGSTTWQLPTAIVSVSPTNQLGPKLANDDSRSLVAWVQPSTGGARIYAARVNPLGEFIDTTEFAIGDPALDIRLVGVYSDLNSFLVVWHAKDVMQLGAYTITRWTRMVARVTSAGVASPAFACGPTSSTISATDAWVDFGALPTKYVVTFVAGDVIANVDVGTSACGSGRFLYENASITDAIALASTANAAYYVSSQGDLYRVGQTTAITGGVGSTLNVGASDLVTLDVLAGADETVVYSNSPPRFPLDQSVGVLNLTSSGTVRWHLPDLAAGVWTTANPQVASAPEGMFVVWRRADNSIVGQRISTEGQRVDPVPVTIDSDPQARFLGDVYTDFLGRALLAYSAVLPEQGWATRIRSRLIDFRYHSGLANGAVCTTGFDCNSGQCIDGVCCDSGCGFGDVGDCQACSVAAGGAVDGTCSPLSANTACRPVAGECDVAEVCDGIDVACPVDAFVEADSACGSPSLGPCDLADRCTGVSAACESHGFVAAGTSCRASLGDCDVEDFCNGSQAPCLDGFASSGTVCRPSSGDCDVAEVCAGSSATCPNDAVSAAGVECRASAGLCDVPEACDGSSVACPVDAVLDANVICRAASNECDVAERCDGALPGCASDSFAANGASCGPSLVCETSMCVDGACVATPVVCGDGAMCVESMGGCPPPPPTPTPSADAGGCSAAGRDAPSAPVNLPAFLLVALALLRRVRGA